MITQLKSNGNAHSSHHQHHQQQQQQHRHEPNQMPYDVILKYNPTVPKGGQPTLITIKIRENKTEKRVKEFDLLHEKLMHVIIISEDLAYFSHIHPIFDDKEDIFTVYHQFPETGEYKIWVDFKPKDGNQTLVSFKLDNMIGNAHKPIRITKESQYTKQIDENYKVELILPKEIEPNKPVNFTFNILDQNSNAITDLTPLMSAGGHSVIISSNLEEFLHVHPTEEVSPEWKGGPTISFRTIFPHSGLYKIWGQFQHRGITITADFTVEVL